jgi:hypothetical protein
MSCDLADLRPVHLGQPVHGLRKQFRRGMLVRVEFLVHGGATQPEVGAEVDDRAARLHQRHREFRRHAMRQGEEHDVGLGGKHAHVRIAEVQRARLGMAGELREDLATVWPAYWREVTATSSACGWPSIRRTSSSPE